MRRLLSLLVLCLTAFACGQGSLVQPRVLTASQALVGGPEQLDFESPAARQELFRELARASQLQAGTPATGPVYFPLVRTEGAVMGAPGLDLEADLLQAPDAGAGLQLTFDGRYERWSDERRDSLQGLSEREAAELVARSLLYHWGIQPEGPIQVTRTTGAPYAVAYMDGMLQVNPSFVYLAAASLQ